MNGCCILNGGSGSWAFQPLAEQLSGALGIPISAEPQQFNYLLHVESLADDFSHQVFIPINSIRLAGDKRLMSVVFQRHGVSTPATLLLESYSEVREFISHHVEFEWCLKYPTGCGANGHRLITANSAEPRNWPRPFIVQELIRLETPEVYRTYCAGGELFGWVVRRFPPGCGTSPWVAHARGARYVRLGEPPPEAMATAESALAATGLIESFGCVDLLRRPTGEWLVLEVGTDGLFNHVDRDLGHPELESELLHRIKGAFWQRHTESGAIPKAPSRR